MLVAYPLLIKIVRSHKGLNKLSLGLLLVLELVTLASSENCPVNCTCTSTVVECINQGFTAVPEHLPKDVKVLFLSGNNITQLSVDSFADLLTQLTDLHLTGNKIEQVEANTFTNLPSLRLLDISNNRLLSFSPEALLINNSLQELNLSRSLYNYSYINEISNLLQNGTPQLSVLDLSNNNLLYLPENIFSSLWNLSRLDLRNNSLVSIRNGTLRDLRLLNLDLRENSLKALPDSTLAELSQKGMHLWLGDNPWNCDCIEDLVLWLRKAEQVMDRQELVCAEPERLRQVRLLQVNRTEIQCAFSKDMKGVLETSYVFLGMVLALIGVIFLFVLYLNRKGIKRWMYNIRDACRDHMEGYHYRYEINSDPRLANLSLNSDV